MSGDGRIVVHYLRMLLDRVGLSASGDAMAADVDAGFEAAARRVDEAERRIDLAFALEKRIEVLERRATLCGRCGRLVVAPGRAGVHTVCPEETGPAGFEKFLAPAAAAALERHYYGPDVDAIASELADELLTCGPAGPAGTRGDRLAIMLEGRELAGWGREALEARLRVSIRKASASPAILEAIQDEEAIERLALALRATSQWFTAKASAPEILWKLAEFLDNPEYARTAIKAGAGRPRS